MNKYNIVWGGRLNGSNNLMDGLGVIEGVSFEAARNEFCKRQLEDGMRIGFCEQHNFAYTNIIETK